MCALADTTPFRRPRLVIAGTHSGSGKTSVVAAILAALHKRDTSLYPFKIGPDYIDPAFHAHITGTPSRNLDSWLLSPDVLRGLFIRNSWEKGVAVIEGVMGLFDGKGTGHEGSTAHVAELLGAPVVLIVSGSGLSRSAAAMVTGYAAFHPGIRVAGVLVNRVKSTRHYAIIRESIEANCGIPCLGYLPENPAFALQSRHLGLVPSNEVAGLEAIVAALGDAAQETIDLDGLLALAEAAPPVPAGDLPSEISAFPVRLAVARDAAFSFYYQDNFDRLANLGAELVFFSPLRDAALPDNIHGLYLGGGFPEVFAASLAENAAMRESVRNAARSGLPVYAECGGMAYLCASLTDASGVTYPMAGVFSSRVEMTGRLQTFGYAEAEFVRDTPLGPAGTRTRTHEFHHSRLVPDTAAAKNDGDGAYRMHKDGPAGEAVSWTTGFCARNVLAAYPHIHFYGNTVLAPSFLARCAAFREGAL